MIRLSNIRVTYSGFISLGTKFSSIITGLVFTLIVTRTLSPEEFGTWALIGSLIIYAIIINPIISYWTTRETARGIESGKTSIIFLFFKLLPILPCILPASFFRSPQTKAK